MKNSNTLKIMTALGLSFAFAQTAGARTDVAAKIEQLKNNTEASQANLSQYESNLKTVNANLVETEKALKQVEKQKQALVKQTNDTSKGKVSVDATKKQIDGFMKSETAKLDAERKQIEELKKTLASLEANTKKREENIAQYQVKMQKVDTELASWSERNQSIIEVEQALKAKESEARAEYKRLAQKKTDYEIEASKWKKQVRVSEREYQNYSKLKD